LCALGGSHFLACVGVADLWWDTDGATAGSGSDTSPSGDWEDPNWSANSAGSSPTQVWVPGETAVFSAGMDATSFFDVVLGQPMSVAGIRAEEGSPRIFTSGTVGVLNFTSGALLVDTSSRDIESQLLFGPTNGVVTKVGSGDFILNRSQTSFAGKWIVNEGIVRSIYNNAFGVNPPALIADQITVNNGAGVFGSGGTNQGLTIGPGGGGFKYFEGSTGFMGWGGPITGNLGEPLIIEAHAVIGIHNPNNNYDGDTILKDGIVELAASEVIPNSSNVDIIGASTLELQGTNETVNSLGAISSARLVLGTIFPSTFSTLTIQNPAGETIAGAISGGGTLVKNGSGALTLSGANSTYKLVLNNGTIGVGSDRAFGQTSGHVTLNGGTMANTSSTARVFPNGIPVLISGDFAVDDSMNAAPGKLSFFGTATMNGTHTITVDGAANLLLSNLTQSTAGVGLTKDGTGTLELQGDQVVPGNQLSGPITVLAGRLHLVGHAVPLGSGAGSLILAGGTVNTAVSRTFPTANPLNVTADSAITTTSVTTSTTSPVYFYFSSNTVAGAGKLTFRNDAPSGDGVFQPVLTGNGATFAPGRIEIANGAFGTTMLGSGNVGPTTQTFTNVISGTGSFARLGAGGTTVVTAANAYSGGTFVNSGTLLVNNTSGSGTGTGAVSVFPAGKLGGTGTISGAVTSFGTIAPGASVGTLTLESDLTMSTNSHLAIELSGASADKIVVGGNLDLSAAEYLDVTGNGTAPWLIATYGGTLTGTFDNVTSGYIVDYTTNGQITLKSIALPGDYNSDGEVDAGDYVTWRANPNAFSGPAGYNAWRANFGNPPGSGSGVGEGSAPVPEPQAFALFVIALIFAAGLLTLSKRGTEGLPLRGDY
jgi:autotransporter-associated beta strand protein